MIIDLPIYDIESFFQGCYKSSGENFHLKKDSAAELDKSLTVFCSTTNAVWIPRHAEAY